MSSQCRRQINGPKVGRLLLWRKQCRKRTNHPSGLCHVHRDPNWYVGKKAATDV